VFDLPSDAPTSLAWFVLWAGIGGAFLFLNKVFEKDEQTLSQELGEKSKRGLEALNTLLARRVARSGQQRDPSLVDSESLDEVHSLVRQAWVPRSNVGLLVGVSRFVRIFSVLQIATAIPAAGIWWGVKDLRDEAAWLIAGVILLAGPAFVCLLVQVLGMFLWTVKRS
jgi:hypothetical protein